MATRQAKASGTWAGWVMFGGTMLILLGTINIGEGIVALLDDKRVLVTEGELWLVDVTGWGWALILFGAVLAITGCGLFTASDWARVFAIVTVTLHAAANVLWLPAYPLWSVLMVALDAVVLMALTARWPQAASRLDGGETGGGIEYVAGPDVEPEQGRTEQGRSGQGQMPAQTPAHH